MNKQKSIRADDKELKNARLNKWAQKRVKPKLIAMAALMICALCALSIVTLYIKVTYGESYQARAITQLVVNRSGVDQTINPKRGSIVDRNMTTLAVSTRVYDVIMDIRLLINLNPKRQVTTVNKLSKILNVSKQSLWNYLRIGNITTDESGKEKFEPLEENDTNYKKIAIGIDFEISREIGNAKLDQIHTESRSVRNYVYDDQAASVIGFQTTEFSIGLERQYESYLAGSQGRISRSYSSNGFLGESGIVTKTTNVKNGSTVITTLDERIQSIADAAAKKYFEIEEARNTSVIVMKPNTGEILAMSEYPTFDLNRPLDPKGVTEPNLAADLESLDEKLRVEQLNRLWTNFNITDTFEPGSTFKPITVATALQENIITTDETYYCPGYKNVGVPINCHLRSGHGSETLEATLYNSCNVAMMDIAEKIGREKFSKYQHDFGFGDKTGIDLPSETAARALVFDEGELGASELATSSFGQRFNATPLQVITAFSAVINGGNLMKPYIVSRIVDEDGTVELENVPTVTRRVISRETSDWIRTSLESVITKGTGRSAQIEGYGIGGKTGTGEQGVNGTEDFHYTMSIATFFPVENPQYVVLVIINRPKNDGASPGPFSKEVMQNIINIMNLPPDRGEEAPPEEELITISSYVGKNIAEVTAEIAAKGFNCELIGASGNIVKAQFPEDGTPMRPDDYVILTIGSEGDTGDLVPIPVVVGLSEEDAIAKVTAAGLLPAIIRDETIEQPEESYQTTEQDEAAGDPGEGNPDMENPDMGNPDMDNSNDSQSEQADKPVIVTQSPAQIGTGVPPGTTIRLVLR